MIQGKHVMKSFKSIFTVCTCKKFGQIKMQFALQKCTSVRFPEVQINTEFYRHAMDNTILIS